MKKYFTKYLPVTGKIKEGDKVYWTDPEGLTSQLNTAVEVTEDMIFMSEPESSEIEAFPHEVQKVKLFLCSREIAFGDTYYHDVFCPYPNGEIADTNSKVIDAHLMIMNEGEDYEGDVSFKVIGEVSPDATWVKEGDEFDEDDIQHGYMGFVFEQSSWQHEDMVDKSTLPSNAVKTILIKGPCGHFH